MENTVDLVEFHNNVLYLVFIHDVVHWGECGGAVVSDTISQQEDRRFDSQPGSFLRGVCMCLRRCVWGG